jgi:3-dehydroquinate synthase
VFNPIVIQSHKGPYEVRFDEKALAALNGAALGGAHFIIDDQVAEIYADRIGNVLASPSVLRIEASEAAKSLERFPAYVDKLLTSDIRRDHRLIAIGGGIIQDITCFLAATLLRGIDWHFYPTTLLAQADSCIGSKSSINNGAFKNILGTFTPPKTVTISVDFLATLADRGVKSGVGEMLKVHAIDGPESFTRIAADFERLFADPSVMADYIRRSLLIKLPYIEKDEFDQGPRNIFNYGHSFGHALEGATNFAIPHGIGVTIGMDMANFVADRLGINDGETYRRMHPTLRANYAAFADYPVPLDLFLAAIAKDKKNLGSGSLTLILPDGEGRIFKDAYPADDTFAEICRAFLEEGRAA